MWLSPMQEAVYRERFDPDIKPQELFAVSVEGENEDIVSATKTISKLKTMGAKSYDLRVVTRHHSFHVEARFESQGKAIEAYKAFKANKALTGK